ncbi:MAG: polysaccharide biosynthesis/export family protein [Bacteroidota bacterium]|nr:polysaccharide biosynthesis/export family protein [Bacteroidota bacterium]
MFKTLEACYFFSSKNSSNRFLSIALSSFIVCFYGTSCISTKNIKYFNNLSDSAVVHLPLLPKPSVIIMPDDILDIKIAGANEATAILLNTYSTTSAGAGAATSNNGYLVDNAGDVEFPIMGKIHAAGLSREEFKERLKERVSKYLKDPLISVKFTNFRFSVLGEVKSPGSFLVPGERVTILEALGLSGDMTTYSRRTNVRVIRDSSGNREVGQLDFTDKAVFTSKYYYLQRNDIVYVEAEKTKSQFEDFSRVSSIVATLASIIALSITVLRK